jgi:predicted PhzF superfamily epimerase YddE/YHI9
LLPRSDQEPLNYDENYSEVIEALTPTDPQLSTLLSTSPNEALREIESRLFDTDNPTFCLPLGEIEESDQSNPNVSPFRGLSEEQNLARLYVSLARR